MAAELFPSFVGRDPIPIIRTIGEDYLGFAKAPPPCPKLALPKVRPGGVIVAHNVTNLRDELADFIHEVMTSPQLETTIENPGPGGFSVSIKR